MNISTDDDCLGFDTTSPNAKNFKIIKYSDGFFSSIPHDFFQNWLGEQSDVGLFHIGKASGVGVGSMVKYDSDQQSLRIGRFVSGGSRLKFILNGQHEMRTISTAMFAIFGDGLMNPEQPQYQDSVIKNDVWIGDEAMMLGGGIIENGCVIGARSLLPPNFRSEAYGIYAGTPAKLIRFRFPEKVREALLDIAWWDMPNLFAWIKHHMQYFFADLTHDEARSLDVLSELKEKKQQWLAKTQQQP
ncbi:CatB-related O-acetyltransferase [Dickeya sp. CFBP 2040]|uniref:CatB-related O-acetyltransferase n=1 Tax=Dickeya poaceiphila TaxID=568768 RepID=A0A5B8HIZ7_9GAMM|nr:MULTISPECIES: CatB-related O-acetyltransferase [Dickeya]NKI73402.1 CatB-related O-acetyltransferase [Dickeya sp. CFBP 2040]QDX29239.1 CatB-related O-acetyltransferase [Dickeya poaceiphila]